MEYYHKTYVRSTSTGFTNVMSRARYLCIYVFTRVLQRCPRWVLVFICFIVSTEKERERKRICGTCTYIYTHTRGLVLATARKARTFWPTIKPPLCAIINAYKNLLLEIYEIHLALTSDLTGFRATNPLPFPRPRFARRSFFREITPAKKRSPVECIMRIVRRLHGLLCEGVIAWFKSDVMLVRVSCLPVSRLITRS